MRDRSRAKAIELRVCDLANQPIPFQSDFFDVVIFSEVLEHLFAPPSEVLKEIRRVMRTQSRLIVTVPNIARLYNRIKLLFGVTPLQNPDGSMKRGWVHGHGHIHEYTMREITSLLETCNFVIARRKFLQPSIRDVLRGRAWGSFAKSKTLRLARALYYVVCSVIPAFRPTIFIVCLKNR